jgi:hypothetical protein
MPPSATDTGAANLSCRPGKRLAAEAFTLRRKAREVRLAGFVFQS